LTKIIAALVVSGVAYGVFSLNRWYHHAKKRGVIPESNDFIVW
jgi:hypothetical protein